MDQIDAGTRIVHRFTSVDADGNTRSEVREGVAHAGRYHHRKTYYLAEPVSSRDWLRSVRPAADLPHTRQRGTGTRPASRRPAQRPSARSGDSGSDSESGEPAAGADPPAAAGRCANCNASLEHRGPRATTCSDRCRVALHRRRRDQKGQNRRCIGCGCKLSRYSQGDGNHCSACTPSAAPDADLAAVLADNSADPVLCEVLVRERRREELLIGLALLPSAGELVAELTLLEAA